MSVTGIDLGASGSTMCYVKSGAIDTVLNEASKVRSRPTLFERTLERETDSSPSASRPPS